MNDKLLIDRSTVEQALEAMLNFPDDISDEMFESIRALRAALAQEPEPVQEPVALLWQVRHALNLACAICDAVPNRDPGHLGVLVNAQQQDGRNGYRLIHDAEAALTKYLTTPTITPPQRPRLTDEEIDRLWRDPQQGYWDYRKFARAIERKVRGE